MTPILGLSIVLLSIILLSYSPSPYYLAALTPLVGFFFSGSRKYLSTNSASMRLALFFSVCLIYSIFFFIGFESFSGSHNQLSAFVALALIVEILYFGKPTRLYILLILISFFIIGNRSSIFLMAAFVKNKLILILFLITSLMFILISSEMSISPDFLLFLFNDGGLLNRGYVETRWFYWDEFIEGFNFFNLNYNTWQFSDVPQTSSGFYDLHNSFLTIIVRDSYLGILKVFFWFTTILYLPFGVFSAVTLRAFHDTFLLGGIIDIFVYALIGSCIKKFFGYNKN
jgi:hypothetical protein